MLWVRGKLSSKTIRKHWFPTQFPTGVISVPGQPN